MRKTILFGILVGLLGCGGQTSSSNSSGLQITNPTQVSVAEIPLQSSQTSYVIHALSFEIKNVSGIPVQIQSLDTEFQCSNAFLDRVGIQICVNGESVGPRPWIIEYYSPYKAIQVPVGIVLAPQKSVRFDIYARPGSASTAGNLSNDSVVLQNSFLNLGIGNSLGRARLQSPIITVNVGGFLEPSIRGNTNIVPVFQSGPKFLAYSETVQNFGNDQQLLDFVFRFRAGPRTSQANLDIEGFAELVVDGNVLDTVPIHGNINFQEYKLFFFGEFLQANTSRKVEIYFTISNAQSGDVLLMDRVALGTTSGINYFPTLLGSEINVP